MQPNFFRWSFRAQSALVLAACVGLIGFAIFSQTQWGLIPCPLCIFQRVAFAAMGVVSLIGVLHAPKGAWGRRIYGLLTLIPAGAGIAIAGRHVWLTTLPPDQVPECGPPLGFMIETNALPDVIRMVMSGSGECAKVDWTLLGLSMPAWSLLWFVLLAIFAVYAAFRSRPAS